MITFEFGGQLLATMPTFKMDTKTAALDHFLVPLELTIPRELMTVEGVDNLQERITTAIEKMVEGLNELQGV